ncbi:MAG TPA: Fe2+-dependent dioxygenase [Stellaceae bacterium]|nr:Fe2+-dependent dioxygenase [Stellaceae bacterium]
MLVHVPQVLTPDHAETALAQLMAAEWVDGRATAGPLAARAKDNRQLPEASPLARELGETIVRALEKNPPFMSAALPKRIFPPLFNRYDEGMGFGAHVDNAIRHVPGSSFRIRTDLSATLFLSPPETYDGGELVIEDTYGAHKVKLPAGDLILYPATSLHRVTKVTRGSRIAAFFWIQSLVKDDGERTLLFELDGAIRELGTDHPEHPSVVRLTATYHNLLRRWSEL